MLFAQKHALQEKLSRLIKKSYFDNFFFFVKRGTLLTRLGYIISYWTRFFEIIFLNHIMRFWTRLNFTRFYYLCHIFLYTKLKIEVHRPVYNYSPKRVTIAYNHTQFLDLSWRTNANATDGDDEIILYCLTMIAKTHERDPFLQYIYIGKWPTNNACYEDISDIQLRGFSPKLRNILTIYWLPCL